MTKEEYALKKSFLYQRQALPLSAKVELAKRRIREWYEAFDGNVYVSFSGGKDSTVLLHLVRGMYPEVPAVFVDTGLEYPEIRDFVKATENVTWLKPKLTFKQIIDQYGWPVVSKEQAQFIFEYRNTKSEKLKKYRLEGNASCGGCISAKWRYLIDAPFKISAKCCYHFKKSPLAIYEKRSGLKPYVGIIAAESKLREQSYIKYGCNSFSATKKMSRPLMTWTEESVWEYIRENNLPYAEIYDKGVENTGCVFCLFGAHRDKVNKIQKLKVSHPALWDYCLNKLGMREVMDFMGLPYE